MNLKTITGTLQCKSCLTQIDIHFDLLKKFEKVESYIKEKKSGMFQRAPDAWLKPVLPDCKSYGRKNTMQPLIEKKKEINWVFMVLASSSFSRKITVNALHRMASSPELQVSIASPISASTTFHRSSISLFISYNDYLENHPRSLSL
ncbi:hypothetical protein RYX36_011070 [Vicia faba]